MTTKKPIFLLILMILIEVILLSIPFAKDIKNENYIQTTGVFVKAYESANTSNEGTTMYHLVYEYNVDEKQYTYTTSYSTSVIPEEGSVIKIKYDPENPYNAYSNSFNVFQIIGVFFIFIPLIMIFNENTWVKDILVFAFTAIGIAMFVRNNLHKGAGMIAIIIFGVLNFASIMEFIEYEKKKLCHK